VTNADAAPAPKKPTPKKKPAAPATRTFQLKQSAENAVHRVSFGASPRISIGAGETFATTDPRLAARLAAQPHLEEVTS
jgi:hypothetical protein